MIVSNGKSINLPSGESKQVGRASQHIRRPCGPSLRRDKQLEEEIKSDLQVTPAFQKFVASKLDNLLELEDVEFVESTTASNALAESKSCLGVRLTKRSKVEVLDASEAEQGLSSPRKRPALLSHKDPQVSAEDLAQCAVTGEDVISCKEVSSWSTFPFFPDRVVVGEQRIKRKKKKVKKTVRFADDERDSYICSNEASPDATLATADTCKCNPEPGQRVILATISEGECLRRNAMLK